MAKIIVFPTNILAKNIPAKHFMVRALLMIVNVFWMLTALIWPVLRWFLGLDVTLQLFRVLIIAADKGAYIDWTLLAHFSIFTALLYFVTYYRP